jgi:predicted GIY-YIG superfamily endonuclease
MAKWNKELAFEVARQFNTLKDFYTEACGCYIYAKRNGLLQDMYWLKRAYKVLTHNSVIEESKKYTSRGEFCNNSHSHYTYARRHNLLDDMVWLTPKTNSHIHGHCIYAYIDEQNKVAYIGQTMRISERDKEHRKDSRSSVFKYFNSLDKEIPSPICLEQNLHDIESQMQEDYWVRQYVNMGYKLLNKAKTGLHCSSLGLCRIKWTKDRVFREAKKYKSSGEFKENNGNAYQIACRKGWIQEIAKNNGWRLRIKWNHETCFYYASKCIDRADFRKQYQAGYKYARKHKLFDMLNFRVAKVC